MEPAFRFYGEGDLRGAIHVMEPIVPEPDGPGVLGWIRIGLLFAGCLTLLGPPGLGVYLLAAILKPEWFR